VLLGSQAHRLLSDGNLRCVGSVFEIDHRGCFLTTYPRE